MIVTVVSALWIASRLQLCNGTLVKPIPIFFVLGHLKIGGNETIALQILQRIDRERFRPEVIVLAQDRDRIADEFEKLGVPIRLCEFDPGKPWRFVWSFRKLVKLAKANIVFCFSFSTVHLWVHLGACLGGAKYRITRVGSWFDWNERDLRRLHMLGTFVCNKEVAVSEHVAKKLFESGRQPARGITLIPNGCDVEGIFQKAVIGRQELEPDKHMIAMVSRMDNAKDHDTLLHAFALVRREIPQAQLRLVGDGPRRPILEALAQELGLRNSVEFTGMRRDIPQQLSDVDVYVFSTRTEGFPNALIEAMAAKLPIVASDIPSCREVLDDGKAGVLVSPGDFSRMAEAILSLLSDPSSCARAAESAYKRVSENYRIDNMVRAYERLFTDGPI